MTSTLSQWYNNVLPFWTQIFCTPAAGDVAVAHEICVRVYTIYVCVCVFVCVCVCVCVCVYVSTEEPYTSAKESYKSAKEL